MTKLDRKPATESNAPPVRVGMIGLGCAKNTVDAEVMLGHISRAGLEITADPTRADVVVINTCGFIVDAKQESIDAILEIAEAKRAGTVKRLVVSGCMAQAYADELAREIPEIDAMIGLDELEQIVDAVRGELQGHRPDQRGALAVYTHREPRVVSTQGHAFLKVAEGCDNPCNFCHIPRMRGAFRSRTVDDLVAEARDLEARGVRELILIAQDTTRYGEDLGLEGGLRRLVEALLDATGIPWIRFLYAYPATLDPGLFDVMAGDERFISYLDIPLQHASRKVLKAMKRGGDARSYRKLVEAARQRVPGITLRTTMIVGHPGEDDSAFGELLDFIREVEFDHLGVFAYSWQEENPGASLGDPVPAELKEERRARVLELQQGISLAKNQRLVGKKLPALVAGPLPEMELLTAARLRHQAPEIDGRLLINDGTARAGSLVEVEITEAHPYDLVGRIERTISPPTAPMPALPVLV